MDLCDPEIWGVSAHIQALQQIATIGHTLVNVADGSGESEDNECFMSDTNDYCFTYVNGPDVDGYDTDTSQYIGDVLLVNMIRKQFKGLTTIPLWTYVYFHITVQCNSVVVRTEYSKIKVEGLILCRVPGQSCRMD